MRNIESYPAEVFGTRVNGGPPQSGDPFLIGAASTFTYDLDVTTEYGTQRIEGVKPSQERWPDTYDVHAIATGTLVTVFRIGDVFVMDARELVHTKPCPGVPPP